MRAMSRDPLCTSALQYSQASQHVKLTVLRTKTLESVINQASGDVGCIPTMSDTRLATHPCSVLIHLLSKWYQYPNRATSTDIPHTSPFATLTSTVPDNASEGEETMNEGHLSERALKSSP